MGLRKLSTFWSKTPAIVDWVASVAIKNGLAESGGIRINLDESIFLSEFQASFVFEPHLNLTFFLVRSYSGPAVFAKSGIKSL